MDHTKQRSLQFLEIKETFLPPPSTLQVSAQCYLTCKASRGTLYFSCSASFFLPDGQLKLLLLILSTIRVYTPDLGYPITQKRVLLKIFPNKYK